MTASHDLQALKDFVQDNPYLERIEAIVDDFNLFAALNLVRYEIRHSAFLRWILDPSESHGLGDYPLKLFLKQSVAAFEPHGAESPSVFDLDAWDLSQAKVLTEWRDIDVLIRDDSNEFVCVVENKIEAGEHGEQLAKYRQTLDRFFPRYRKLLLFLTVSSDSPSDDAYIPVTYEDVVDILERVRKRKETQLGPAVDLFLNHYVEMVRRFIVANSEIQELCRQVYENHRRALDLIFEFRPDRAAEVRDAAIDVLSKSEDVNLDDSSKIYIRFIPKALDFLPRVGEGWTSTGRLLLFELENTSDRLRLKCVLGPGDQELRERIYAVAQEHPDAFGTRTRDLTAKWYTFFTDTWLSRDEYNELEIVEIEEKVRDHLTTLLSERVGKLITAIKPLE